MYRVGLRMPSVSADLRVVAAATMVQERRGKGYGNEIAVSMLAGGEPIRT